MNAQMICFLILGLGPVVSLVVGLVLEILTENEKRK